MHKQLNDFER